MQESYFKTSEAFTLNTYETTKNFVRNSSNAGKEATEFYKEGCVKLYIGPSSSTSSLFKSKSVELSADMFSLKECPIFAKVLSKFELFSQICFKGPEPSWFLNRTN